MATKPTVFGTAAYTVKINGVDLYSYGVANYACPNLGMAPLLPVYASFPERHDAYAFSATFQPRPFAVTGVMIGNSAANLRANLDLLKTNLLSLRGIRQAELAAVRVEVAGQTDRYYPCIYTGGLDLAPLGYNPTAAYHFSLTLPLVQLTPFAYAVTPTRATPSGTGPSFTVLDTGSAPCPCVVELEGVATAPSFALANISFYADFDYDAVATIISGATVTGTIGATTDSDQFEPGDFEKGRFIQGNTFTTSWASVITTPAEGTVLLYIRPQFASTLAENRTMFEFRADANNHVFLQWDNTSDTWIFYKTIGASTSYTTGMAAQAFAADDYIVLAFSWGPDGMKTYVNGIQSGTNVATTGITGSSGTAYLGDATETARPDCKYEYVYMLPYQLSDDNVTRYSLAPHLVRPANVAKTKTGNLTDGQRSIVDCEKWAIDKVATDLTRTNDMDDWDSNGFPLLPPDQVCFYVPSGQSIAGIKVNYRRRFL